MRVVYHAHGGKLFDIGKENTEVLGVHKLLLTDWVQEHLQMPRNGSKESINGRQVGVSTLMMMSRSLM